MPVSGTPAFDTNLLTLLRQTVEGLEQGSTDAPSPKTGAASKSAVTSTPAAVGAGSTVPTGDAPDISANNAATAPGNSSMSVAVASLFSMMPPNQSDDDTEVELASVEAKMKQTTDKVGDNEITTNQERQRNALTAKKDQLEKAQKAMDDAAAAQKHASVWDKVKLAFSFVGALLTIAAGILVALTAPVTGGLGALAGGLMIAGGVMMLMMAIDQTMAMVPGKDGQPGQGFIAMTAKAITKAMYPDDPDKQASEAAKWTMGLTCALMVASAICGIAGAAINPAGAAGEVVAIAATAGKVAEIGSDASDVGEVGEVAQVGETAADIEAGATETAELGTDAGNAASESDQVGNIATDGTDVGDGASDAEESTETVTKTTTMAERIETAAEDSQDAANDTSSGASKSSDSTDGGGAANQTRSLSQRVADNVGKGSKADKVLKAGEGVNDAANAGTDGPSLYYHYEASTSTATSLQNKAQAKQFEALDKSLDDAIDAIMLRLKNDGDRFSSVLSTLADAVKDHGNSMSHVKFRA